MTARKATWLALQVGVTCGAAAALLLFLLVYGA